MCATKMLKRLVPRLRLGTHTFRALPGNGGYFRMVVEAEPPYHAFPGGAWERDKRLWAEAGGQNMWKSLDSGLRGNDGTRAEHL